MTLSKYTLSTQDLYLPEDLYLIKMIVKRKKGYYVLSESTGRNLGGPYSSRAKALKRLRQVEFFKHLKK